MPRSASRYAQYHDSGSDSSLCRERGPLAHTALQLAKHVGEGTVVTLKLWTPLPPSRFGAVHLRRPGALCLRSP